MRRFFTAFNLVVNPSDVERLPEARVSIRLLQRPPAFQSRARHSRSSSLRLNQINQAYEARVSLH